MEVSGQRHDPAALPQEKRTRLLDSSLEGPKAGLDAVE
jgi:hypothetical protein